MDSAERPVWPGSAKIVIYSPAPPTNMLHLLNEDLGRALTLHAGSPVASVVPMPLPDSINAIVELPEKDRPLHLPIVTTVDLLPAIEQSGPSWHAYSRANTDLKLVAALYEVAFGVFTLDPALSTPADLAGKRIGAAARPSSVRVLTEALLRDGWGVLDAVELIDLPPDRVGAALASGDIHATTWNFLHRSHDGFAPLLPEPLKHEAAAWLPVAEDAVAAIGRANPFEIGGLLVPAGGVRLPELQAPVPARATPLLSFKQAIAAWNDTEDEIVLALLQSLVDQGSRFAGLPANPEQMLDWPSLTAELLHPAARGFFERRGVAFH